MVNPVLGLTLYTQGQDFFVPFFTAWNTCLDPKSAFVGHAELFENHSGCKVFLARNHLVCVLCGKNHIPGVCSRFTLALGPAQNT